MNVNIVVDVGNTRMKWGRCAPDRVVEIASLPPADPSAWQRQWHTWGQPTGVWGVSGSHPEHISRLAKWLSDNNQRVSLVDDYRALKLDVRVDYPHKVGMDRLLNALAVKTRLSGKGPAIIVDAGSAVTVDYLD